MPARQGVIVLCAPDIVYLADRDGDGRPEVRETLFTGFGVGEMWTRISNPQWGVDNWIYAASGADSDGTIRGPHLANPVRLGNTGFRFKADGTAFEPVSGSTGGFRPHADGLRTIASWSRTSSTRSTWRRCRTATWRAIRTTPRPEW